MRLWRVSMLAGLWLFDPPRVVRGTPQVDGAQLRADASSVALRIYLPLATAMDIDPQPPIRSSPGYAGCRTLLWQRGVTTGRTLRKQLKMTAARFPLPFA
jgi:hypothetical protein